MRTQEAGQRKVGSSKLFEILCVALVSEQLDAILLKEWRLRWKLARLFVFGCELPCRHFGGFNVRLIERADADDRSGDGGGDFPAVKFLAHVVTIAHSNSDHPLPGLTQSVDLVVLIHIDP